MVVSALHMAAPALRDFDLVATNGADPVVRAAIESLTWETGLPVRLHEGSPEAALERAVLFVAVAVRETGHLPLAALHDRGIPSLVPVQFPGARAPLGLSALLLRAAHDPRTLAERIVEHVRP